MAAVAKVAEKNATVSNEEQLVTMIVDRQLFGIPILQVQDIVEATNITPVPLSTSAIAGMLNLRGRIVTVIDLRKLLGNDEEVPWESQMGVTVEYKGDLYTLLVDSIGDVRSVRRSDFDKAPSTLEPETRRLCSGIYRLQGSLLVVLEVSRIMTTDVIGSATVLTVAERKARKAAALENAKGKEDGGRQISSRMTGLSGYEGESESATEAESSDDIKQRKKENRNRRPVAERWREAMTERARRTGQSIYRLREPDEETLETAREEMDKENAEWEARMGEGPVEGVSDESAGDLAALVDEALSDEALSGEAFPDMPALDEPGSIAEQSFDASDEPVSADFLSDGTMSDEPVSDQPVAADEPGATDEPGAPDFAEIPAGDDMPPADDMSDTDISDTDVADTGEADTDEAEFGEADTGEPPILNFARSTAEKPATDDVWEPDSIVDDPAAPSDGDMPADDPEQTAEEPVTTGLADMKTEEPAVDETPELADDMAAVTETPEGDDLSGLAVDDAEDVVSADDEAEAKSGMLSGFWNRLRGPEKNAVKDEMQASDEDAAFDDMPSFDDDPSSDDEPAAEDEPKKTKKAAKSRAKAKPAAKKKTPAKSKSDKSDKP